MNISGRQYSKATKVMRRPITNQELQLTFVYPILSDESLFQKYGDLIRDFISVSMLKEIFVSNALDIVSMSNDIHSILDEKGQKVNPQQTISNIKYGQNDTNYHSSNTEMIRGELQDKITQKFAVIQKISKIDPTIKKLRPYYMNVSLQNLMDVPVIVGSKIYSINSFVLSLMLIIAVADRKYHLNFKKSQDVDKLFKKIEMMNGDDIYNVMNNLIDEELSKTERIVKWFKEKHINIRPKILDRFLEKKVNKRESFRKFKKDTDNTVKNPHEAMYKDDAFSILNATKNDINVSKAMFQRVIDSDQLRQHLGLNKERGQFSSVTSRLSNNLQGIFIRMEMGLIKTMASNFTPFLDSIIHLLTPHDAKFDTIQDIKHRLIEISFVNDITNFMQTNLSSAIKNNLTSNNIDPEIAQERIELLANLCQNEFKDSHYKLNSFSNLLTTTQIKSGNVDTDKLQMFLNSGEKVASDSGLYLQTIGRLFKQLMGGDYELSIEQPIYELSYGLMNSIIERIREETPNDYHIPLAYNPDLDITSNPDIIEKLRSDLISAGTQYLRFIISYSMQLALCEYTTTLELEVETIQNDALDLPNYTLIIPIEMLMVISAAFAAKSFRDYTNKQQQNIKTQNNLRLTANLNSNNIKGILKYMNSYFKIPNIFVIDEKAGMVYYKLMYQSEANKIKLTNMNTFIQQILGEVFEQ